MARKRLSQWSTRKTAAWVVGDRGIKGIFWRQSRQNLVMRRMRGRETSINGQATGTLNRIIKAIYGHVQSCTRQGHSVEEARGVVTQITLLLALVKP